MLALNEVWRQFSHARCATYLFANPYIYEIAQILSIRNLRLFLHCSMKFLDVGRHYRDAAGPVRIKFRKQFRTAPFA